MLERDAPNPLELFQIWLNLPTADKMVDPHFSMLWSQHDSRTMFRDAEGRPTDVTVVAAQLDGKAPPPPPPQSWASRPDSTSPSGRSRWRPVPAGPCRRPLPASGATLYFFRGSSATGRRARAGSARRASRCAPTRRSTLENGDAESELLLLQGRPIGEPVAQYGPFVMNTPAEIQQAFADYRRTEFGGWPWPSDAPVHPRDEGRFAKHADGRREEPR